MTDDVKKPTTRRQAAKKAEPEAKETSGLAKFKMVRGVFLVQPATGIRISLHEVKELKDDSWAEVQTNAGLFERV